MRFETEIPINHKVEPATVDNVDEIDSDGIGDLTMEELLKMKELRKRINEWKFKTMYTELSKRKNSNAIYEKCKLARQLSIDLATRIIGNQGDPRFNQEAFTILGPLGNPNNWSNYFTASVRNAISTDLYEYPMTFNSDLITTFKNRKYPMFE